jgi:galactokinase
MSSTSAADLYRRTYGRDPDGVFSAPGRVNLIGEHTDYNGGLVLPFAIDARAYLAAGRADRGTVRVASAQKPGEFTTVRLDDIEPGSPAVTGWPGYLLGAIWSLRKTGRPIEPVDLVLDSQVPAGAGLSSSAAVECATVLAASALAGYTLRPMAIARIAQRAENDFVGVPCGPMDQTASAACAEGAVLLFDTRSGTVENIPFDPAAYGLTILVVDTRVAHSLADGEYGKRRASCDRAARLLGVPQLRDIPIADLSTELGRLPDDELRRRVRHVVTENDRVVRTVELLRAGRVADIGDLLIASHISLRDDYQVSCAELDLAVDTALATGALGARMTGGGFGGSVITLVPTDRVDTVGAAMTAAFADHGYTAPVLRSVTPEQGARRET